MSWKVLNADEFDWLKSLKDLKPREDIVARIIQWQLAKRRSGCHSTKTEPTVAGSGRKLYRQKGTGNARHGSRRTNMFRGGAIIFGPLVRDHGYKMPKKVRLLGLRHAFAALLRDDRLKVVSDLNLDSFKTKSLQQSAKPFTDQFKKVLCIDDNNDNLALSTRNMFNIDVLPVCGINVYDLIRHDGVVISKGVLEGVARRLQYA